MLFALRQVLAVIAALASAFLLVIAVEIFSSAVYPIPQGPAATMAEICEHVARYPHWILAVVVALYSATAFLSTWIATRIGNRWTGIAIGLILGALLVCNIAMLPYTLWFKVVMLACFPVACYIGVACGASRPSPAAASRVATTNT
jgi:hypothetical protein